MKLDFKLLKHQIDFIKSKENTMLCGGYGSGKSDAGTYKTILKKLQYPDKKVAYYLPHYGLVRDVAFDKFPAILEQLKLEYKLNKSDKEINITNYGTIIFRSMDNAETIVGYETAYSLIDEADILPMDKMEKVYQKILGRNRAVNNAICDAVSTPEGFKWLYKMSKTDHFKVIKAKTTDNKFLPEDYISQLEKQYPPNLLKAYLFGEFVNLTSGAVYNYFDRDKHFTNREIKPNDILYIGQDFNIGGCCGRVIVIDNGVPYLVDEFSAYDTQGIVTHLKATYNHKIEIIPDSSGNSNKTNSSKTDIQILRDAGYKVNAPLKNPLVKNRVNTLNNMFYQDKIKINPFKCPDSVKALEQQAYDKNGVPEKFAGANTIDDSNDALGYVIHRLFGGDNNKVSSVEMSFA